MTAWYLTVVGIIHIVTSLAGPKLSWRWTGLLLGIYELVLSRVPITAPIELDSQSVVSHERPIAGTNACVATLGRQEGSGVPAPPDAMPGLDPLHPTDGLDPDGVRVWSCRPLSFWS